ncbi:protein CutA isoform X1 [Struthio camelus]|uniref:protein CutA isoform X1 n=1 Tax=Struthio camelus TaxID=8801 RepID=UPI003603C75D
MGQTPRLALPGPGTCLAPLCREGTGLEAAVMPADIQPTGEPCASRGGRGGGVCAGCGQPSQPAPAALPAAQVAGRRRTAALARRDEDGVAEPALPAAQQPDLLPAGPPGPAAGKWEPHRGTRGPAAGNSDGVCLRARRRGRSTGEPDARDLGGRRNAATHPFARAALQKKRGLAGEVMALSLLMYPVLKTLALQLHSAVTGSYVSGTHSIAFINCLNEQIAKDIARYFWKGEIEESTEILLLVKTRTSKIGELSNYVRSIHPFEIPEIISLPIDQGNPLYLKWIEESIPRD